MNVQTTTTTTKCNTCSSVIAERGQNGAVQFKGANIDLCANCATRDGTWIAANFISPAPAKPGMQKVRLSSGQTVMMPASAPLPAGATVVTS